ncbi:spore germination protein GerPC [Bacillus sp. REN3]|uniref:spore germination protein GerPC n=1 Tax=Bacillus sp. REN3 TaxID=2802440 RepID=UPI001FEEA143|nr:spore germination protein GerPC [Bacillus sp. REN3]
MYAGLYQYLTRLHLFVEHQNNKIARLEKMVLALQEDVQALKERPPVQIGNIEYKFDQLKVETLEGTLNIGLNPTDLEDIDDFSVDQKTMNVPVPPNQIFKRTIKIETAIQQYLETDLETIYRDAKEKLGIQVEDSYFAFIKEDIKKQLSGRVAAHLKDQHVAGRSEETSKEADDQIIELLKQEIQNGVYLFLKNLPDNMKEGKEE